MKCPFCVNEVADAIGPSGSEMWRCRTCCRTFDEASADEVLRLKGLSTAPPDDVQQSVADRTWRRGFLHLTVDGDGLVSLWDEPRSEISYLKLPLTPEQELLIKKTMEKGGPTP